jgi:phage gp29-like protein
MARDKSQTFALTVAASLKEMQETLQRDLVRPLMAINGVRPELEPMLRPDAIQHRSVSEVTTALVDLSKVGYTLAPQDPVVEKLFDMLGLPKAGIHMPRPEPQQPNQNPNGAQDAPGEQQENDDESE